MIKSLIFDLDGVLFDGVDLHKSLFIEALTKVYPGLNISKEYHDKYLNGLSTRQKLNLLLNNKLIDIKDIDIISQEKQDLTLKYLCTFTPNSNYIFNLITHVAKSYNLYCVSNSKRDTLVIILKRLNILEFFKDIISNEDINNPKPNPEPYNYLISKHNLNREECLILEDSRCGKTAAYKSGCHVLEIVDPSDVTIEKIEEKIRIVENNINTLQHINIVVPMAGHGLRFSKSGYTTPKPFIPVFGKPMIEWVIENMMPKDERYDNILIKTNIIPHFHFVAQAAHLKMYDLSGICQTLNIDYTISCVDKVTEGPACTVLLTEKYINNEWPLVTVNSDQYLEWDVNNFYRALLNPSFSGCINTFYQPNQNDLKWSYVKLDESDTITEVAEKKWLSPLATTGIYGWKSGKEFVKYANQMIAKNERVNNEFYVCPVYNYLLKEGKRVRYFSCKKLWGLGVPEDLENFIKYYTYEQA